MPGFRRCADYQFHPACTNMAMCLSGLPRTFRLKSFFAIANNAAAQRRKGAPTGPEHKQTGMNGPAPFTPVFVVPVGYLLMAACTSGMELMFC
jgi:hypothetical protein